jgi:hypothetical protein
MTMTLTEIKSKMFVFFRENNMFVLSRHKTEIFPIWEYPEMNIPLLEKAFEDFEARKLVEKVTFPKDGGGTDIAWILIKPLSSYEQELTLSPSTVLYFIAVAEKLSQFNEELNINLDPMNITEGDIQKILFIIASFLKPKEE